MTNKQRLGLAMALALTACGGGSGDGSSDNAAAPSASSSAKASDPCSLVTAAEVAAVIGEEVTAQPGDGRCEYQTADAMASSVTIELNQSDAAGEMQTARQAAGVLKDMGGAVANEGGAGADTNAMLSETSAAPTLGDEAFFGPNQQLSVRKGGSYIAVTPPMMRSRMAAGNPMLSAEDKRKMAIAIAEKALARLP